MDRHRAGAVDGVRDGARVQRLGAEAELVVSHGGPFDGGCGTVRPIVPGEVRRGQGGHVAERHAGPAGGMQRGLSYHRLRGP